MGEGKEPRIYVDTNVILDVIERRRKKDDSFLLLDKIKNEGWYCCTSAYTICELIDKEQEFLHVGNLLLNRHTLDEILKSRKPKDLSQEQRDDAIDKVRGFFKQYKIEQFTLEEKGWETAYAVLRDLNISASDAIQVATAIEANCSIFISNDGELGKEAQKKLVWMSPTQANQTLKGQGVTKEVL
jgi:predicted nucleic acid-binding protein